MNATTFTKTPDEWDELIDQVSRGDFIASTGREQREAGYIATVLEQTVEYFYTKEDAPITINTLEVFGDDFGWDAAVVIHKAGGR